MYYPVLLPGIYHPVLLPTVTSIPLPVSSLLMHRSARLLSVDAPSLPVFDLPNSSMLSVFDLPNSSMLNRLVSLLRLLEGKPGLIWLTVCQEMDQF